ncbi:uncharacterized protein LOC127003793 isoform X4 [Eriocheir sinensis]|uniref:uncharacterized protein LOC127003793 isoform X4 n=1 Tax=Eriocheir sinensis TaxID=95602 RepID=UPI0021C6801E|nr:uncharacterized protein LOC127003793 isoform X4 [Eriocheir sinensis]
MVKMLKFENPPRLSAFKCSTLPLDKPTNNFAKMRRILRASGAGGEGRQDPPSLPVPTVPPYPIELFENNPDLGHTNRAFNLTDEFLEANNLKTRTSSSSAESRAASDDLPSVRSSPEGAVYNVSGGTVRSLTAFESEERTPQDSSPRGSEVTTLSDEASLGKQSFRSTGSRGPSGSSSSSSSVPNGESSPVTQSSSVSSTHSDSTVPNDDPLPNAGTPTNGGAAANDGPLPNGDTPANSGSVSYSGAMSNRGFIPNVDPISDCEQNNGNASSNGGPLTNNNSTCKSDNISNGAAPANGGPNGKPSSNDGESDYEVPASVDNYLLKRNPVPVTRGPAPRSPIRNGAPIYHGAPTYNGAAMLNGAPIPNGAPMFNRAPMYNGAPVFNDGPLPNGVPAPRFFVPTHGAVFNGRGPPNWSHNAAMSLPYGGTSYSRGQHDPRSPPQGRGPVRHSSSGRLVAKSASLSLGGPVTPVHRGRVGGSLNFSRVGQQLHPSGTFYPDGRHRMERDAPPPPPPPPHPGMTGVVGQAGGATAGAAPPYRPPINHSKTGRSSGDQVCPASVSGPPNERSPHHPSVSTTAEGTTSKASIPIYSQVCKAKKTRKAPSGNAPVSEASAPARRITVPRSSAPPNTVVRRDERQNTRHPSHATPSRSDGSPLYEDLREFEDEGAEERQYNIEVKIDYSRGSKYQMETRHIVTTKNKNGERTQQIQSAPEGPKTTPSTSENRREKTISKKLREVGEMKNFRLGVIHVIRVGKWRFVALCCCGNTSRYVHQPGRIENYVPGYSSLAEKELKRNPEADVKLESQSQEPPPVSVNHRYGSQKMSMTHALKESGYESDSTLVFKKREDARRLAPDPRKTSQVYRQIQRGGDIPITGLQKPNPPKPKEEYYVVYSDLDLGLHHPSLSDLLLPYTYIQAMPPPSKPPVPTFGDRKRSAPSRVVMAPSPPRRISSKWHPSLLKPLMKDRPPVPSARSTSAERVRETRALYSTWHREKVARSREKLGTSPTKTTSLGRSLSAAKQTQEVRENFLKTRRTVSESRFTIEDRENSPPRRTSAPAKAKTPLRHYESRDKLHRKSSQRDLHVERGLPGRQQDHVASPAPGHSRSLSADASRKWSSGSADSGRNVMRHTVSSMNKIKRTSLQQNHIEGPCQPSRSSSTDSTCRRRPSTCLSPEPQPPMRKTGVSRKDSRSRGSPYSDVSLEASDDKKLKQSESFDTTQSNETGYSSMIDLSPSPTPDRKLPVEDREKRPRKRSEPPPPRAQSSPVRRSRFSTCFVEQRNKWEAITRGDAESGRLSRSTSRSTSPLRSLQLVRQVSSSFKDIPAEVSISSPGPRRSRSLDILTPSPHSHPHRYRQYIIELRNAAPRNARISQLRRLFTSLERVHRLERSVSSVELSAAESRSHAIIDFETWKGLREKERKALEYNVLLKELDVAQKEKEFLYKVTPEKKWSGDCRLRGRDIHVNDLRDKFSSISDNTSEVTYKRRREIEISKDTYRGLWRGSSVRDLSHKYQDPERRRSSSKRGSSLSLSREDSGLRSRGLWTSLSLEQVNAFRDHLAEIYGSMQSIRSWRERKQRNQDKGQHRAQREFANHKVDVAETGRALADKLRTLHGRAPSEPTKRSPPRHSSPTRTTKSTSSLTQVEDQRRQLSKQLSIEFQEKVMEQKSYQGPESAPATLDTLPVPDVSLSLSPESLSRSSPRTCYSLDISDSSEPNSLNSDQLLLVVQKPGKSGRSQSLPPEPASDPESSDSEVSVRTVVHKDVAGKVKFFEKRARRNSRSSERHSSRGSQLNVDEVPHYATLPSRLKQQSQSKLLSPNYLPERSVSSVNLNSKADVASQAWRIYDKTNPVSGSSLQRLADMPLEQRDQRNPTSHSRSYLYNVKTGDVNRLKRRFESPEEARRRTRSLPNVNGPLSRVTPTGRTVVRGQESGDVQFMKAKYETPRRSRSPERWQPVRDEYLPKSKLTSTMQTLANRSMAFREPDTIERLARRDSVEKAVLRRVHTGNVEASVDRLESRRLDAGSNVSIIGQMYTSTPSMKELANMAPLIPPRPPPPLLGPQKPQRMNRSTPQPLLTSTPTPSPIDVRAAHKQRALSVQEPVCPPPMMVQPPPGSSTTFKRQSGYNADAHRPKARYIPQESYGSGSPTRAARYGGANWTQSLERPQRVTRAMTHSAPPSASDQRSYYHHAGRHPSDMRKSSSPADYHTYSQPYSQSTYAIAQPSSHRPHDSLSPGREQSYGSKAVSWKEPLIGPLPFSYLSSAQRSPPARPESPYKYESGEVNIHYRTPVRIEQKESIPEEELARRQEEHMKKVYENERRKKYLAELEDIERRRHTDNFTSPQARRRYLSTLKVVSRLFSSVFSLVRSKHNHPKATSPDFEVHIDNEIRKWDREMMHCVNGDCSNDGMGVYISEEVYV